MAVIESFVFSGLSRNRCMNNLSVSKSSSFISEFIFCFVVEKITISALSSTTVRKRLAADTILKPLTRGIRHVAHIEGF